MPYPNDVKQPFHPHNAHEGRAERCPTCGQMYTDSRLCAPFAPAKSGLLDLVLIAKDALTEVQAALEEEVFS